MKDEDILEAARTIRSHLNDLISDEASLVDNELAFYLNEAQSGKPAANILLGIMCKRDATRLWAAAFLKEPLGLQSSRAYQPPPGDPVPVGAPKYVCPQGDYAWYRISTGSPIPKCPTHNVVLVAAP
jgi:hypothetical protein